MESPRFGVLTIVYHCATRKPLRQLKTDLLGSTGRARIPPRIMATKDERIGVRVPNEVKTALLTIAKKEGRSLAQVCELLLKGGTAEYEKDGPEYIRRLLVRPKGK